MLKSIIIDDEIHGAETLEVMLKHYCPDIELLKIYNSAEEGLAAIKELKPDVVFLDIEMPQMNGFDLLKKVGDITFDVIFTTAYNQFALRAFRFSAIDYLVKPVDKDELIEAVNKVLEKKQHAIPTEQFDLLLEKLQSQKEDHQRIALPTMEGLELVSSQDIIRCDSDSNYTNIKLTNGKEIIVSRTLKEIEKTLPIGRFFRVHHSHIVNLDQVARYKKGDGGFLIMSDKSNVSVSRSKKDQLLKMF